MAKYFTLFWKYRWRQWIRHSLIYSFLLVLKKTKVGWERPGSTSQMFSYTFRHAFIFHTFWKLASPFSDYTQPWNVFETKTIIQKIATLQKTLLNATEYKSHTVPFLLLYKRVVSHLNNYSHIYPSLSYNKRADDSFSFLFVGLDFIKW